MGPHWKTCEGIDELAEVLWHLLSESLFDGDGTTCLVFNKKGSSLSSAAAIHGTMILQEVAGKTSHIPTTWWSFMCKTAAHIPLELCVSFIRLAVTGVEPQMSNQT